MASFIGGIVNVAIGAIVLQAVYLTTIHNANACVPGTLAYNSGVLNSTTACNGTTGYGALGQASWSGAEISLWNVLGLAGIIGLLVGVLQLFGIM